MKKLLPYLIFTILFISGVGYYFNKVNPNTNNLKVQSSITSVKTTIDFGNENKISYSEENYKDLTAYDLLKKIAEKNNIEIKVKQYDFGVFIEEIDGKKNTAEKSWIFFINGKSATEASDKYKVQPGDLVEWKYIKPEF